MRRKLLWAAVLTIALLSEGCDRAGQPGTAPPSTRVPTFDYQETSGCGRCTVYRTNLEKSEVFVVFAKLDELSNVDGGTELDLVSKSKTISVTVEMYPRPQKHLCHCTDSTDPDSDEPEVWTAIRGKARIERFAPEKGDEGATPLFRVKVTVTDVEFRDAGGRTAKCPHPVVLDAKVGWIPG